MKPVRCLPSRVLMLVCLVALGPSWGVPPATAPDGCAHVVGLRALSAEQIGTLLALPGLQGSVEFGDVALLLGDAGLAEVVTARFPSAPVRSVALDGRVLRLARRHVASADTVGGAVVASGVDAPALPAGVTLLVGRGRQALVLAAADAPSSAGDDLELLPLPRDATLVQRADRLATSPVPRSASSPLVAAAVQAIDLEAYGAVIDDLCAFGTRHTSTSTFPDVTTYLADAFTALGYAVTLDPFQVGGNTRHNVIAEIAGDVTPDDVYVVCGHYDSTSQTPSVAAPGADDNASGAAGVVEMARVLRQYRFDSTIRFICFAAEEQGLVGSNTYVNDLVAAGTLGQVRAVINLDMVAYLNTGVWDVLIEGKSGISAGLLSLLPGLAAEHTALTSFLSTNPYGSDHMPFINHGVNAVLTIEYEDWDNPHYHKTTDRPATLTLPFAVEILKLDVAGIATLAGIEGGYMLAYGSGVAGSGGLVPALGGDGSTNLGQAYDVRLADALGGASGLLVLGTEAASLPKYGGTILVGPPGGLLLVPLTLGGAPLPGAGWLDIHGEVPQDPALTGLSLHVQYVLTDPGAPLGKALSNGLRLEFGI